MAKSDNTPHYTGHRGRLRTRLLEGGADSLHDYELLEMALWVGNPRGDTKPLAKELIAHFGSFADVVAAEPAQLKGQSKIGDAAIAHIKLLETAGVRLARARIVNRDVISSWDALVNYCRSTKQYKRVEEFHVLYLDSKNFLLADEVQNRGTINQTAVYPREIVRRAIELGAVSVIIVHNHPSGDSTPSRADIAMTQRVQEAVQAVDVTLHDHLVIGAGEPYSFRSRGML